MSHRSTSRTNLPALLRRLDANTTRTDATPYSLANLGREGRYATASDYGAYHAHQFNRADELADDMSAARYGCTDEAPPALPASDLAAATAAHALYAARALREVA